MNPHLDLGPCPCIFVFLVLLFIVCNFRFIQPGSTQSGLVHGTCTVGWRIVAGESRGNRGGMFFLFVAENILPIKSNCFEIRFTVLKTQLEYVVNVNSIACYRKYSALDPGLWKDPFYLHFTSTYNQTKQTDIRLTKKLMRGSITL